MWVFAVSQELGLLGCVLSLCSHFQTPGSFSRRDCSISFSPAAMRLLVSVPSLLSLCVGGLASVGELGFTVVLVFL